MLPSQGYLHHPITRLDVYFHALRGSVTGSQVTLMRYGPDFYLRGSVQVFKVSFAIHYKASVVTVPLYPMLLCRWPLSLHCTHTAVAECLPHRSMLHTSCCAYANPGGDSMARALWGRNNGDVASGKARRNLLEPLHSQEPHQHCASLVRFVDIYRHLFMSLILLIEFLQKPILPSFHHTYQAGGRLVSANLHSSLVTFAGPLGSLASRI